MPKYPSHEEVTAQYAARDREIDRLKAQKKVSTDDIRALDRLGRFLATCELWNLCDRAAQDALLNDEHPHVRSSAAIAATKR